MTFAHDVLLDLSGLESPIPMIRTKETLDSMLPGQVLCVVTTQRSTIKNIRTLVANNPYELVQFASQNQAYTFIIRKN